MAPSPRLQLEVEHVHLEPVKLVKSLPSSYCNDKDPPETSDMGESQNQKVYATEADRNIRNPSHSHQSLLNIDCFFFGGGGGGGGGFSKCICISSGLRNVSKNQHH